MPVEQVEDGTGTEVLGYAPFDPRSVDPLSSDPGVEQASADGSSGTDIEAAEEAPEEAPLPAFDERCRENFDGLLFIGALETQFRWRGHVFVMRTLDVSELLEISLLHKEYLGSLGETKSYQAAMIAASLVSVDGRPLAEPLAPGDSTLRPRFEQVIQWFPPTLDALYEEYLRLEIQVDHVVEAMGKVPG